MNSGICVGNAGKDAPDDQGWLFGYFKPPGDRRHSGEVEIKWGMHPRGDQRPAWVTAEYRTALLILVSDRFRVEFRDRDVVLTQQGDYVVWGAGVDHSWTAEDDSVVRSLSSVLERSSWSAA